METLRLHIKNMVCPRCIKVVREELEKMGLKPISVQLGIVDFEANHSTLPLQKIRDMLDRNGFELLMDKNAALVEKIKGTLIELIYSGKISELKENISTYLSRILARDYSTISGLFTSVEGITIEKYFILQKIERVKELLVYNELTLSEIAWQLGYSSVQALSNQFKKVTGLSPSHFKRIGFEKRKSIDDISEG